MTCLIALLLGAGATAYCLVRLLYTVSRSESRFLAFWGFVFFYMTIIVAGMYLYRIYQ